MTKPTLLAIELPALLRSDDVWVQLELRSAPCGTSVQLRRNPYIVEIRVGSGISGNLNGFHARSPKAHGLGYVSKVVVADIDEDSGWELGVFHAIRNLRDEEKLHNSTIGTLSAALPVA